MENIENISKLFDKSDWTLKNDIELKDVLQNFSRNMIKNINEMEIINNNLDKKLFEMLIRLQHVHNRINCTKTERFIEERVDDFGNILAQKRVQLQADMKKKEIPQKECEQRTVRTISNAILKSFEKLRMMGQEELETLDPIDPSSSNSTGSSIQRQQFANKLLSFNAPPIIGTSEFNLFLKKKMKRIELKEQEIKSIERINPTTKVKLHEEGDVGSISSNRSVPPQDPTIATEKALNPLLEEIVGKMTARKNLFSSNISISGDGDKMEENEANKFEKEEQFIKNNATQQNRRENDNEEDNPQQQIDEFQSTIEEEEMSKPVFKTFDSAFSDRLTTALQHGPITLRSDRTSTIHRPLSAQSITSSGDEQFGGITRTLRKTESSISSNEELGPATVKTRIAQIGSKIPMARSSAGVGENISKEAVRKIEDEQKEATMPMEQTEALKNRVKGPARRVPTKMAKSSIQIEPQKTKELPPVPPPKQKGRSIFSSSSSEDDLAKLKNDLELPKRKQQPPLPTKKTEIIKTNQQIISSKKDSIGKKQRGLFDDTDSDF